MINQGSFLSLALLMRLPMKQVFIDWLDLAAVQSRKFYYHLFLRSAKRENVVLILITPSQSLAWLMLMMPMLNQICCFAPSSPPPALVFPGVRVLREPVVPPQ